MGPYFVIVVCNLIARFIHGLLVNNDYLRGSIAFVVLNSNSCFQTKINTLVSE